MEIATLCAGKILMFTLSLVISILQSKMFTTGSLLVLYFLLLFIQNK